jgi:hypothetical protein
VIWPSRALFWTQILLAVAGTALLLGLIIGSLVKEPHTGRRRRRADADSLRSVFSPTLVWIVLILGLATLLGASREGAESYTELFLVGADYTACGSSGAVDASGCTLLQLGVVNRERAAGEYRLVVRDTVHAEPVTEQTLSLQVGERRVADLELPAGLCSSDADVSVELYRGDAGSAYRALRLSCRALSAADRYVSSDFAD